MAKKASVKRGTRSSAVKHVHYIFVILSVIVIALIVTVLVSPLKESSVLGVQIAKGKDSDHTGNIVNLNRGSSEAITHTTRDLHAGQGNPTELAADQDKTGRGNGHGVQKLIQKLEDKHEKKAARNASDSADEDDDDDLVVASESGERIHIKKNRKEKILVLPEKAVAALLKNGIIQQVASGSGSASSSGAPVVIFTRTNGTPVYIVAGSKDEKLFGAFPVHLNTTVTVSAETGEVVSKKESLATRILDLFSF